MNDCEMLKKKVDYLEGQASVDLVVLRCLIQQLPASQLSRIQQEVKAIAEDVTMRTLNSENGDFVLTGISDRASFWSAAVNESLASKSNS